MATTDKGDQMDAPTPDAGEISGQAALGEAASAAAPAAAAAAAAAADPQQQHAAVDGRAL